MSKLSFGSFVKENLHRITLPIRLWLVERISPTFPTIHLRASMDAQRPVLISSLLPHGTVLLDSMDLPTFLPSIRTSRALPSSLRRAHLQTLKQVAWQQQLQNAQVHGRAYRAALRIILTGQSLEQVKYFSNMVDH